MIEAELPDGTVLEFPDGTSDAVIQGAVRRQLGAKAAPASPPARSAPAPAKQPPPLAGSDRGGFLGGAMSLADQMARVFGGAVVDTADNVSSFLNDNINAGLRLAGVDAQLPTHTLKGAVPQPVGAVPQITRGIAPYFAGGAAATNIAAKAAPLASRMAAAFTGGASTDAVMSGGQDANLSNLVEDLGGPTLPTARRPGENPGMAAVKDMAEGGVLGMAVDKVVDILSPGVRRFVSDMAKRQGADIHPDAVTPEMANDVVRDPKVRAIMEANGYVDPADPVYAQHVARVEQRVQAEQAKAQAPEIMAQANAEVSPAARGNVAADGTPLPEPGLTPETAQRLEQLQTAPNLPPTARADVEGVLAGDIAPGAARVPEPVRTPDVIPVDPQGRADLGDPAVRAGADLRSDPGANLPAVVEPPRTGFDARMTPQDFAQAEARAEGGQRNPVPAQDTLYAPEGRAPQTRADIAGQREAGQAFDLAARQRERVAPPVRDTQAAGVPNGPEPQRVLLDDGFPVQVVGQTPDGRVTVRRYDPRTGAPVEGAVEYTTPRARLQESSYTAEPRRAQDFGARDNPARSSPELPRTPDQPVSREPTQTYRATSPDANEQFPAAGEGRSPLPEQPPGPMPGADQPRAERAQRAANEEELRARYEQARADSQYQDFSAKARERYKAETGTTSNKEAPLNGDGRLDTDEFGYVKSDKGGPIRFGDQKQAAKWIINVGHKQSVDQVFEVANHPKGGFTAVERGRSAPKAEAPETRGAPASAAGAPGVQGLEASNAVTPEQATSSVRRGQEATRQETAAPSAGPAPSGKSAAREAYDRDEIRWGDLPKADQDQLNREWDDANFESLRESEPDLTREQYEERKAGGKKFFESYLEEDAPPAPDGDKPTGTKLYSNPLDPEAVGELFGKPLKETLDKEMAAARKDKEWLKQALSGVSKDPREVLQLLARVGREAGMSIAGGLRSYAKKYPNVPEIGKLADALATDPGSGRAVAEPFEYAANREAQRFFTRAQNLLENWKVSSNQIRRAMTGGPVTAADAPHVRRLRALLDEWHKHLTDAGLDVGKVEKFFPRNPDAWRVAQDTEGFIAAATKVYKAEGHADPAAAAKAWADEIVTGGDLHVTRTPGATLSTRSTRERTFKTKAADQLLAPWMQDAKTTLADYFTRTAKQAEFARRFGAKGEKLDEAFDAMRQKGVSPDDISSIRNLVDNGAGLIPGTKPNAVSTMAGWVHAIYTMRLLGRALTSQVSEPFVAAVRTGDIRAGLKGLGAYLEPLTDAGRLSRKEWRQRAELMGILGDLHTNAMLMNRAGANAGQSKLQGIVLTRFFKTMGVQPITEFQMNTATRLADWRLRGLLEDLGEADNAPSLRALADEFGLDEAAARRMKAWTGRFGDKPPPIAELMGSSQGGKDYGSAVSRWVNETIQNPTRADKPAAANDPRFRAVYGITSFMFTYTRKVTMKMMKDVAHAATASNYTPGQRFAGAAGPSIAFGMLAALNYGVWYARQAALNPQSLDELTDDQKTYSAMSQGQMFGNFAPLIDLTMSVGGRFNRDMTSAYAGPQYTQAAADLTNMIKSLPGMPGNSPNTNNAEWQGSRAAYNAFVVNTALMGSTLVPTGPLGRVGIFVADQALAAPGTSRAVADAVAGERTVKPKK